MTIGDNNTISASDLNTDLDASRSEIDTVRKVQTGLRVRLCIQAFDNTADAVARQVIFTPQDNYLLEALWVDVDIDGGGTGDYTATLAVASGETEYILDDTVSATVTISGTPDRAIANHSTTSNNATRYVLRQGVAYSLTVSADDTADNLSATAVFKVKRRTR